MTTNDGHGSWTTGSTLSRVDPGDASLALEGPRYQQDRELGRGGHGVVQLCRDQIVGREIAVKTRIGKRNLSRFIREARIQGQLEHPAIVPVYDLGIDEDDHVYFSMKRLRGRTLRNVIKDLQAGDHATAAQFATPADLPNHVQCTSFCAQPWRSASRHQAREHHGG